MSKKEKLISWDKLDSDDNGIKRYKGNLFTGIAVMDGICDKDIPSKIHYKDGELDGSWTYWYKNGQKSSEQYYKNGIYNGLYTEWHENGQKKLELYYKNGRIDGQAIS